VSLFYWACTTTSCCCGGLPVIVYACSTRDYIAHKGLEVPKHIAQIIASACAFRPFCAFLCDCCKCQLHSG
jgi:hypothetical protein